MTMQLEEEPLGARDTMVRVEDNVKTFRIARMVQEDCGLMETLFSMN